MNNVNAYLRYGMTGFIYMLFVLPYAYLLGYRINTSSSELIIAFLGFPLGALFYWVYYGVYVMFRRDYENNVLFKILNFDLRHLNDECRESLRLLMDCVTEYQLFDSKINDKKESQDDSKHETKIRVQFSTLHAIGSALLAIICANITNVALFVIKHRTNELNNIASRQSLCWLIVIVGLSTLIFIFLCIYRRRLKDVLMVYEADYIYKRFDQILENLKKIPGIDVTVKPPKVNQDFCDTFKRILYRK